MKCYYILLYNKKVKHAITYILKPIGNYNLHVIDNLEICMCYLKCNLLPFLEISFTTWSISPWCFKKYGRIILLYKTTEPLFWIGIKHQTKKPVWKQNY